MPISKVTNKTNTQSLEIKNDLLAIVMAGGLSSRMGHDKANISLHGEGSPNLLSRTTSLLSELGLEVWISGRHLDIDVFFCFDDIVPNLGPVGGIATALELAKGRPCLVLSCDLPFMDTATLKRLIERRNSRTSGALLTIYVQKETGFQESLAAIYEPETLPFLKDCLEKRLLKLNKIVPRELQEHVIYNSEESLPFFNINYPADLEAARRIIRSL